MKQLDIITKKYDQYLLLLIIALIGVGTVMLYSASSFRSLHLSSGVSDTIYLISHLKRLIIGLSLMFFFIINDYRKLKKIAPYLMVTSISLLIITKISYIVKGDLSAARWLDLGIISFQTSDIARFSLILYLAFYIDKKRGKIKDFYSGFFPALITIGLVLFTITIQPDFSTAAIIGLIGFSMLFIGGAKLAHMIITGIGSIGIMFTVMLMEPYRLKRVFYWAGSIAGLVSDDSNGHQAKQSLISLGNGGFDGLGLGNSIEKNLFLPEPHTDFIFAIIGEELGLFGAIIVLTIFLLIFQRGIKIAKDTTDPFGIMLSTGISFSIIIYAFINISVVTGVIPVTGLALPLISHGGSNLITNLVSLGILINISQSKRGISRNARWKPMHNE